MLEDAIDGDLVALDDAEDALRHARLGEQLGDVERRRWGSFSDGLRMKVLPQAMALPNIHMGTMAGKLKGVMPATTPSGWRIW